MSSNVKKSFVKLYWLKSYWAVNLVFCAYLLLFLAELSRRKHAQRSTISKEIGLAWVSGLPKGLGERRF